ncbi:MAG TPA: hypothetical protein HPP97_08010 [Desulfuromonadales bacterium]|nr:hypothetical protein [Desulfuromonadales bacterium]
MEPVGSTYRQPLTSTRAIGGDGRTLQGAPPDTNGLRTAEPRPGKVASASPADQKGFQATEPFTPEFKPYGRTGAQGSKPAGGVETPQNGEAPAGGAQTKPDPQVQAQISQLKSIEEKVKAHEAAHKTAGGTMTGPVSYTYTRGPDGKNYITGGEVPISISSGKTPQETISRMQQVIQAALAPADPSPQDRAVAAQASAMQQEARQQLAAAPATGETRPPTSVEPGKQVDSLVARDSQRAYGNPAVTGKQSESAAAADPVKPVLRNPAPSSSGAGNAALSAISAAGITGFGQAQQISYYA